jgi:RNA polymerase sigma-70 factor (ECF subfamily)
MKDKEAKFIQMIQQHEKIIFKVIAIYAPNALDKKDWYQEIMLQLWKAFDTYQGDSKPSTWIYRVSFNTIVTGFRQRKRRIKEQALDATIFEIPDDWKDKTAIEDSIRLLYVQINMLNEIEKAIVLLYLEEKSYDEIAEITGLSTTNIGSRLSRIRKKIKKQLKN